MLSSGYAIFWLLHFPVIASSCSSILRLLHCQVMAFSGLLLLGYCIFRLEHCHVRAFSGLSILRLEHSLLYHCPVYNFRAFSVIASSASPFEQQLIHVYIVKTINGLVIYHIMEAEGTVSFVN
jgi:hypothetical protein